MLIFSISTQLELTIKLLSLISHSHVKSNPWWSNVDHKDDHHNDHHMKLVKMNLNNLKISTLKGRRYRLN
ncbi:Uncharacterised protein [Sphingobacterium multivorum]|uniref:Uncharacterized protein n=1 Tax=Sphingobacterium multivorum TaxID=28454 RepID=A0A2X2J145_SPHMU|nr:Uncharacterised protein [Sphingobacterium multivorum]